MEAESLAVGFHHAGENQIVGIQPVADHADQAAAGLRRRQLLEIVGEGRARLVEDGVLRGQGQRRPDGAVLLAQLLHGPGYGLRVQVGVQAVDNLKRAPGHAVGGEGRVLLPLQGVVEKAGNEEAAPCPEEERQHRQHPQRHLYPELHTRPPKRSFSVAFAVITSEPKGRK